MSKKRIERNDAYLVTGLDPMHRFMTSIMGDRTSNEAVTSFDVDITAMRQYLAKRNEDNPEARYTVFHVVSAAIMRTVQMRPSLNWFIRDGKFWERKRISIAAIAKKKKADGAEEGLLVLKSDKVGENGVIDYVHDKITGQVSEIRNAKEGSGGDGTMKAVDALLNLPKPLYKLVMSIIRTLDRKGRLPASLADVNPYGCTCFITNLASIGMNATYHHLINFGSNSFFLIMGKAQKKPVFHEDGTFEMREMLPISMTIDERIADGVYFGNSIRIFKALMQKPEYLERPLGQEIDKFELFEGLDL